MYKARHPVEMPIFCDGSKLAYGAVAYLRFQGVGKYHVSFVMSKVRLTPLKRDFLNTIPRIEINAAKVGVELLQKLLTELEFNVG